MERVLLGRAGVSIATVRRLLNRFLADRRGATAAVITLMIVPIVGAIGMAVEGGGWYLVHRAAQNAADAASVAASINACAAVDDCHTKEMSVTYAEEAAAVAVKFGFTDDASTDIATTKVNCPGTTSPDCYQVAITKRMPVTLVRLVGFNGDATLAGQPAQTIRAASIARPKGSGDNYCITTIGTSSTAINLKGGGPADSLDFGGCDFLSKGGAECTNKVGTESNIGYSDVYSTGSSKDCGTERKQTAAFPADSYPNLADGLPNTCGGVYPKHNKGAVDTNHQISGSKFFTDTAPYCGDIKLTGDVTISKDSRLVIQNGRLDLAGFKITAPAGVTLTIILASTGATGYNHTIVGDVNSGLNFQAPKSLSDPFHGVAVYQDDDAPDGRDMVWNGNKPAINITGIIYAPAATIDIGGNIQHATAGDACIAFYVGGLTVNGTIDIFTDPTRECVRAGASLATIPGTEKRQALVQ